MKWQRESKYYITWDEFVEMHPDLDEHNQTAAKEMCIRDRFSVAVKEYIYDYNNKRIQAKTKWMPPVIYRQAST